MLSKSRGLPGSKLVGLGPTAPRTHLASAYLELLSALASDRPLALAAEIEQTLRQADSNKERDRFLAPLVWLGGYYRAVETGFGRRTSTAAPGACRRPLALLGAPEKDSHLWARLHFELGLTWKDFSAGDRELHEQSAWPVGGVSEILDRRDGAGPVCDGELYARQSPRLRGSRRLI